MPWRRWRKCSAWRCPGRGGAARTVGKKAANLYQLLAEADHIYRAALKSDRGAVEYLKNRGIEGRTAARFAMGYAPDSWNTLLHALGTDESRRRQLLDAGLLIRNENGKEYDRFRGPDHVSDPRPPRPGHRLWRTAPWGRASPNT